MSSPYAQKGSSGGSVYAQKGSSGGSVYAGKGGGGAPAKKKGHGFLSTLKHVVTQTPKDLGNAALQSPGGIYAVGKAVETDILHAAKHGDVNLVSALVHGKKTRPIAKGMAHQAVDTLRHPLRHPGDTVLLLLPGVGQAAKIGEAGALARAGASARTVAKAATVGVKPGPRVLKIGDMEVRGHYSRAAGSRTVQKLTDRALEKGATKSLRVESQLHRRAAKWETRNQRTADAVARAPGTKVSALGAKLKPAELRALRLVAEETPVERRLGAQEMRKGRATHPKEQARHQERIDLTRAAMEHLTTENGKPTFKPEATKLKAVYTAIQKASADREGILKHLDLMDEASLQASKTKTAQVAAGGEYVKPTAARLGVESETLKRARQRVVSLQRRYDTEAARAQAKAVPYGNVHTRTGLVKQDLKTAPEAALKRQHVEVAAGPKTPGAASDLPARGIYSPRLQRLGGALSIAKDELASVEQVAASRVKPTGIVGAEDIVASPDAIHIGNPVERTKIKGNPKVSSTGTLGHGQKPSSLKVSTGGSVEHALERNDVTNIVAERHAEATRLGKIDRVVQKFKGAGEHTPRRKDDVWMWTDKVVSNERIPKDVREYLDNPESISKLSPDKQQSLFDKVKDATFEKHDWQDPEKVAGFQKLAQEGKGVFVPRKLLGEFAKRSYSIGDNPGVKFVDTVNNAQKAGLVYLKLNYPVIQAVSNTAMNIIHQGFAFPKNITKAVTLESKVGPEYAAIVDDIMGQGAITQAAFEGQGAVARGTQKLAHVMSSKVDTPARRAAFYHEADKAGYGSPEKFRALVDDEANVGDLYEVAQRSRESIVDYGDMGPVERNIVRRLIFVYPWQKGAVKYAGHFLRDHPVQAAALAQLGELGKQQSDEQLGPVPSYLEGLIPVGNGRTVNPGGVNFFQTPAQIGTAAAGFATRDPAQRAAGLGFLAPFPGITAALLSGHDDIGRPLKGNLAATLRDLTVAQTAGAAVGRSAFPDSAIAKALLGDRMNSKTYPDPSDAFWRFGLGGLYPRKTNRGALNQNAAREKTGR